jgi:major membrane immunogen (membrane-anchored lipoprotein)
MKKVILSVAVITALLVVSCKRNHTCTCTTSGGGISASASSTIDDTKSSAKKTCTAQDANINGVTTTCTLQ